MPSRALPNTDEGRLRALNSGKTKNDSIPLLQQFLSADTKTPLNAIQPLFQTAMLNRGFALADQAVSTAAVNNSFDSGQMHISHFIQVFNLGVQRGIYPKAHRPFYNLDINSAALPALRSEQDITTWGLRISAGDAARIAAGGAAMANPTAADVAAAIALFNTNNTTQSTKKDAYDAAQEAVEDLREEADKVIKKLWDEVETHFDEEEPESKRRKASEWGVVYRSDIELTFNITVKDSATNAVVENAVVQLDETGNTKNTDAAGVAIILSKISDEANFTITHPDYTQGQVNVLLPTGTTEFNVEVLLVHI
jgi:hypothetical protein